MPALDANARHDEHNQAVILTSGVTSLPPSRSIEQWLWEFVTRYSGATVPDFHRVPGHLAVFWMGDPSIHFKEQLLPTLPQWFCQAIFLEFFLRTVLHSRPGFTRIWRHAILAANDSPPFLQFAAPMIQVEALTKLYGEFVAVTDLSFAVQPGEVLGLVGPNGAGKTTTLRCLAGIIPPTRGTIRICGHPLALEPIEAKRNLAFFTDEPRLFDYLTVQQHLNFTARIYNVVDYQAQSALLLDELELADKKDALPAELSRGMKQKLAIACGLLHSPKVIYFDEPLTGLDPIGIRRMKDSILKRAREGAAIILSSHLLHLVQEICSHLLILKKGKKVIDGTIGELSKKFASPLGDVNLEEVFFRATADEPVAVPRAASEADRPA